MSTPLWQHPLMATLEDGALRPGGLELTRKAYDSLTLAPNTRILDAGCGTGVTGEFLQQEYGVHVTGLDLSSRNIVQTKEKNIPVVQGTVEQLPFSDGTFNIVNCDCVLSLCNSLEAAVTEFGRVLCSGGTLILSDLYRRQEHYISPSVQECSTGGCSSSPIELKQLFAELTKAGFTHTCSTDCTKELKELTAKLIFSGIAACCNNDTQHRTASYDKNIGYIQVRALKKG